MLDHLNIETINLNLPDTYMIVVSVGNIENVLGVLYIGIKGRDLNIVENYYVYLETKKNKQIMKKLCKWKPHIQYSSTV
jgi:hypothetical protein